MPLRLSVCCVTRDPGARVAAALLPLRKIADEIVVAVDATLDPEHLGAYESVADVLVRFEFGPPIESSFEWLKNLCSGEWVFRSSRRRDPILVSLPLGPPGRQALV
jgi:hypothetical protein